MQNKFLFAGMIALAATFTACSNDDEMTPVVNPTEGNAYMAISLVTPNDGTRAEYEYGLEEESEVKNVDFYFYKSDGSFKVKGSTVSTTLTSTDKSDDVNVSRIYNTVVSVADASDIAQVFAVVNCGADFSGKTLAEAKSALKTSEYTTSYGGTDYYIMTGSVYDSNVYGAYDCTNKFYDTKEKAESGEAVEIYVERVAAKVNVKLGDNLKNVASEGVKVTVDGTEYTVKVLGWTLNATEPESFLMKNITAEAKYFTNWNAADKFRCFWAEDPNYTGKTYLTGGYTDSEEVIPILNYVKQSEVTTLPEVLYSLENTYGNDAFASYLQASTSLLVVAQFGDGKTDYYEFNGTIYDKENCIAAILATNNVGLFYAKEDDTYKQISADMLSDLDGADVHDGHIYCQLTDDAAKYTWYKYNGTGSKDNEKSYTAATAADVNAALKADNTTTYGFKNGLMYYSIPIKHLVSVEDGVTPTAVGQYGIVRNHVYTLSLESITGLGHAIWNPDEHIVPVSDTNKYMKAKLNVLSWRIVPTQNVVLK